ncbi:MAG: PP2C family protein-serine/threonine phosphatase, partial [Acidobacteriota bacterium]
HSALRLLPDRMTLGPELMARLNRHIFESSGSNKFITMVLAGLDAAQGRLNYLSAGHNPGVLARAGGRIEELGAGGLPLGLLPGAEYTMEEVFLHPGDLLCLYSDGITECAAPDDEEYELERLIALLESRREEPLEDILEALDQEVTAFADGLPQGDDQTVVLLRRNAVTTSADDPDTET